MEKAYAAYLDTIPESKRLGSLTYTLKDVVATAGFGIGSAGLPAYNLLVEGHTQALENDVVLSMKQGNVAAPSRVVDDEEAAAFFAHHGHRTAVSQSRAAGARRPVAGLDRDRRHRLRGGRGLAVRRGPGLVGALRARASCGRWSSSWAAPPRRCTA